MHEFILHVGRVDHHGPEETMVKCKINLTSSTSPFVIPSHTEPRFGPMT